MKGPGILESGEMRRRMRKVRARRKTMSVGMRKAMVRGMNWRRGMKVREDARKPGSLRALDLPTRNIETSRTFGQYVEKSHARIMY